MFIKFRGSLKDRLGDSYRIDIIDTELTIVGAKPEVVTIISVNLKRKSIDKVDAIHSGSLSLELLSVRDMQFFDLYTSNQYKYIIKVYRNEGLFWSGHIDSEVYEEPYNYSERYPVLITASDFGLLKRNKLQNNGNISIFSVVKSSVEVASIAFNNLYIADTITTNGVPSRYLESLYINVSNFEDKNIYEIVEGVLKSFSLRLFYNGGDIYITDFNTLYKTQYSYNHYSNKFLYVGKKNITHNLGSVKLLNADATISVQPVFQNAEITYKINPDANLLKLSEGAEWKGWRSEMIVAVPGTADVGFKLETYDSSGSETMDIFGDLRWIKMIPYHSDAKVSGAGSSYLSPNYGGVIIKNKKPKFITPSDRYRMRVRMSVLLSVSINPFERVWRANEEGNNKDLRNHSNIIWFRGDLYLKDRNGKVLYYYVSNHGWVKNTGTPPVRNYVFAYYKDNRTNESPAGCLMTNGVFISNNNRDALTSLAQNNIGNGDIVAMPPVAGYLDVIVYSGFECFDYKVRIRQNYSHFKWLIYDSLTIDIEDSSTGRALVNDDIVYKCRINDYAKDEYKETLLIGSNIDANPLSKSSIYKSVGSDYQIVTEFLKNGKTKQLEDFRIITLFSNFAEKLVQIDSTIEPKYGFGYVVEGGKKMLKMSSDHNIAAGNEKVKLFEFCEDNYEVNYE